VRRRRLTVALGIAGLATAALGGGVLSADAVPRTFELTLADGRVLTLTVDAPASADVWSLAFPGVEEEQITAISELPTPPPPPGGASPAAPGSPDAAASPGDAGSPGTTAPAGAAEPDAGDAGPGERRPATGGPAPGEDRGDDTRTRERAYAPRPGARGGRDGGEARDGAARRRGGGAQAPAAGADRPAPQRAPDGLPTLADPALSIAAPGPLRPGVPDFFIEKFRIPPFLLPIYQAAGTQHGIRWELLAAINEIETDYGRNLNVSSAGALGWMQFMPATWRRYGVDANGDGLRDPYNPVDAIFAAARYLEASGAARDLRGAIFAYNHADWYVDSVLMRARLIGGLPADLVSSLTGLTHGVFPVAARARYAGDAGRDGLPVYARPGSRVVAVQDGVVVRRGRTRRFGRYVELRDAYGNRYRYARLASLARRRVVAPGQATSLVSRARATVPAPGGKERLYAHPERRPAAERRTVGTRPLRVGSRVVAGTTLGRIGTTVPGRHAHVLFAIRPAGRGAPRVDPKPILDGWKLLERTALVGADGRDRLFAPGATPTAGQVLLMSREQLRRRVLANPRIDVYACGQEDIRAGRVDRRVLATLEFLAAGGLRPSVTSLRCGHSYLTASGNVSHHSTGTAVDIARINGIPVLGHQGRGSITDVTVRRLLTLQGEMRPDQIISLMRYEGADNTLAMADHADHIHVGWRPEPDARSRRRAEAVLRPTQWIRLIDRLARIDNPTVRRGPAAHVITVRPRARRGD